MGSLSQALPGVRELRGPVVAGYLWLFLVWLQIAPLPQHPRSHAEVAIADAAELLGTLGVGAALSVVAYLIGSVSHQLTLWALRGAQAMLRARNLEWERRWAQLLIAEPERLGWLQAQEAELETAVEDAIEFAFDDEGGRFMADFYANEGVGRELRSIRETAHYRLGDLVERGRQQLTLPASLLAGDDDRLFEEVDRRAGEAHFRVALLAPLVVLLAYLAFETGQWLAALFGLVVVAALVAQAWRQYREQEHLLDQAWAVGKIEVQAMVEAQQLVSDLPRVVRERVAAYSREAEVDAEQPGPHVGSPSPRCPVREP